MTAFNSSSDVDYKAEDLPAVSIDVVGAGFAQFKPFIAIVVFIVIVGVGIAYCRKKFM
jgi:hypothetical protein